MDGSEIPYLNQHGQPVYFRVIDRFITSRALASLTGVAAKVYLVLSYHARSRWQAFPSLETIAELAGVSPRTVQFANKELEAQGCIRIQRRGKKSNLYTLFDDAQTPTLFPLWMMPGHDAQPIAHHESEKHPEEENISTPLNAQSPVENPALMRNPVRDDAQSGCALTTNKKNTLFEEHNEERFATVEEKARYANLLLRLTRLKFPPKVAPKFIAEHGFARVLRAVGYAESKNARTAGYVRDTITHGWDRDHVPNDPDGMGGGIPNRPSVPADGEALAVQRDLDAKRQERRAAAGRSPAASPLGAVLPPDLAQGNRKPSDTLGGLPPSDR